MAARAGDSDYGRLSVMIQYHCKVEALFRVGPGAFQPQPKVDSAFVRLTPYSQPPVMLNSIECLATLVRQAFSQRRKTLRNAVKGLLSEQDILATGSDPSARPETISLEQYAALANKLSDKS
jgi:16S rRNA (adenine1518-N6/adenine1519-N6)-dimethyltransferase